LSTNNFDKEPFFDNYVNLRKKWPNSNDLIEQPTMRRMVPDLSGGSVLDLGCGYGANCMEFVERGATRVVGIDISEKMLNKAMTSNASPMVEYRQLDMENLSTIQEKFDLAYSSLAFHYVKDFDQLVKDIYGLLNMKGFLIFSQEHPLTTAPLGGPEWFRDEQDKIVHYNLSDYMAPGERKTIWLGNEIIKYHRPVSDIMNSLIRGGFVIDEIVEPLPTDEAVREYPYMADEFQKPSFLAVKARKLGQ
jgi:ubiquinone/menaquinone biosynthesis C-methylase UbiE